jgi:N-acyl-D-amino-acid deacylase
MSAQWRYAVLGAIGIAVLLGQNASPTTLSTYAAETVQPPRPPEQPGARYPTTGKTLPFLEPLDAVVYTMMSRHGIPGAALAITKDGKLVCARGYGWANLATRELVQPGTEFGIASLSKTITAAAILKLVEQGKLSLDDKAFKIIAHIKPLQGAKADPRLQQITVRHLLNHSGGWDHKKSGDPVNWTTQMQYQRGDRTPVPTEYLISHTMGIRLDFDPGTESKYSNFGFIVLGEVIEKVSGRSYEEYVREHVLKPIGVPDIRLHPPGGRYFKNEAHRYLAGAGEETELPAWQQKYSDAAGGWTASAVDMLRFVTAIDGSRGKPFFDEKTYRLMLEPPPAPLKVREDGTFVGLGWDAVYVSPKNEVGYFKDGSWFGMRSFLKKQPNGVNWVLLFNASMNPDTTDTKTIGDAVHQVREVIDKLDKFPDIDLFAEFK